MQDKDPLAVKGVEDAAKRLHDLPIPRPPELLRPATTLWVINQLLNVAENARDQIQSCERILQGDVVGNSVQVAESRLRPDYFNHGERRALA